MTFAKRMTALLLAAVLLTAAGCAESSGASGGTESLKSSESSGNTESTADSADEPSAAENSAQESAAENSSAEDSAAPEQSSANTPAESQNGSDTSAAESSQAAAIEEPGVFSAKLLEIVLPDFWGKTLEEGEAILRDTLKLDTGTRKLLFDVMQMGEEMQSMFDMQGTPYFKTYIYDFHNHPLTVCGVQCEALELKLNYPEEEGGKDFISGVFFDLWNEDGEGQSKEIRTDESLAAKDTWKETIAASYGEPRTYFNQDSLIWDLTAAGNIKVLLPQDTNGDIRGGSVQFSPGQLQ